MNYNKYVLGLAGSPRKDGKSEKLLDATLKSMEDCGWETEKIHLASLNINGCSSCGGCIKTGECVMLDDMQMLYEKFETASHLVLASPVYFMGISWCAKKVIDRCQALWVRKYILKEQNGPKNIERKGMLISTAGTNFKWTFDASQRVATAFMNTLNFKYSSDLFVPSCDVISTKIMHEQISMARDLGKQLVK